MTEHVGAPEDREPSVITARLMRVSHGDPVPEASRMRTLREAGDRVCDDLDACRERMLS